MLRSILVSRHTFGGTGIGSEQVSCDSQPFVVSVQVLECPPSRCLILDRMDHKNMRGCSCSVPTSLWRSRIIRRGSA